MNSVYQNAFHAKIKTKPFEQFSLLLFDPETSGNQQKLLIDQILFGDQNNCPQTWLDYVSCVMNVCPDQKMQVLRLVNKAISCVDENKFRSSKHLLKLHLICASLKR